MGDRDTYRRGGRRSDTGGQESVAGRGDGAHGSSRQGRLNAHENFERYSPQRARRAATSSRVRTAYQQTRIDVEAHKRLHADAQRYASSSSRYRARDAHIESGAHSRAASSHRASGSARGGSHSARRTSVRQAHRNPLKLVIAGVVVVALIVIAVLVFHPFGIGAPAQNADGDSANIASTTDMAQSAPMQQAGLPTPIMAESEGVQLHSAVTMDTLTEVLIHNASYSYALPLETKLKEGTNVDIMENHGTGRVAAEQPTGDEWMTGEFIRTYRAGNGGPKMSAIDCGAAPGTQVYAPVSGTVQLVRAYKLYNDNDYDDYEIHIQPDGHPELDVVLIHLTDPSVQRGDVVEGGVTPIAKVRDVYTYIGEAMQLKKYTAQGDNGNHTHIQVNDATSKEYHGLDADRIKKSVPLSTDN